MSGPDAAAKAFLDSNPATIRPAFLCWLDIVGDPVRATTWPAPLTMSGTGDPDLDGYTFDAIDPTFVNISPVQEQQGGSETVTASLSGLIGPDNDLLNLIGDETNWKGRAARLWQGVANEANAQQGAIWPYYTGTMSSLQISVSPEGQTIQISIETYLAILSPASNRTYLDQGLFDSGDKSAEAAIAIANGGDGSALAVPAIVGGINITAVAGVIGGAFGLRR